MSPVATLSGSSSALPIVLIEDDGDTTVELTYEPLDLAKYAAAVQDDGAGAVSTFSGTTRNTFEGKAVLKLEYEAYAPMAVKKMREICEKAREKWPLKKVALAHRVGVVAIGEASVIIAMSSVHRRESLEAVHWAIDELKATVPVWKKEYYADGSSWKQNAEWGGSAAAGCGCQSRRAQK
eukprot:jgi/Mesvir1/8905/Mv02787-RA.1